MWRHRLLTCGTQRKHNNIFLSLSSVINSRSPNHRDLIRECSPNRLMVESDYNDAAYLTTQTWDMVKTISEVKGWPIEEYWEDDLPEEKWGVVHRLKNTFHLFERGRHSLVRKKDRRKQLLEV